MPRDELVVAYSQSGRHALTPSSVRKKLNPSPILLREGFFNWGYIVVEKNPILDMKGLSYSMSRLFDYLRYGPCLSRAQVFSSIFSSSACTLMDDYGCTWNSFEAKDGCLDTVQYASHAGGQGFDSPHLHHFTRLAGSIPIELSTASSRQGYGTSAFR